MPDSFQNTKSRGRPVCLTWSATVVCRDFVLRTTLRTTDAGLEEPDAEHDRHVDAFVELIVVAVLEPNAAGLDEHFLAAGMEAETTTGVEAHIRVRAGRRRAVGFRREDGVAAA